MGLGDEALPLSRSGGSMLDPPFLLFQVLRKFSVSLGELAKSSPLWWQNCVTGVKKGKGGLELPLLVVAAAGARGSLNVPGLLIVLMRKK